MLPQPATYTCHAGERTIFETDGGALMFSMNCIIDEQTSIKSFSVLVCKDGSINGRTIENLKEVFGWNGMDFFWLVDTDLSNVPFEIVVEPDNYNGKNTVKVAWINKPGGKKMQSADRQDIMAKYGASLRAMAGAQPKDTPQQNQPSQQSTPPAPHTQQKVFVIPKQGVLPSSGEQAWNKLLNCVPNGTSQEEAEKIWYKVCALVNKPQAEFNGMDWGGVEAAINVYYDEVV